MTNNTDRLPEIKARHETEDAEIALGNTIEADPVDAHDDRAWLIAELEQTRSRLADAEKVLNHISEQGGRWAKARVQEYREAHDAQT